MESKYLSTKSMMNVLRPLVEQLELLTSCSRTSGLDDILQTDVEELCSPLLQLEDNEFKEVVLSLKVALRDYYDTLDLIKLQKHNEECEDIFKNLLCCVYSVLDIKNKKEVKKICTLIESCEQSFMKLLDIDNGNELIQCAQVFMRNIHVCFEQIKSRACDLLNVGQQQQILLCVRQITKSILLLIAAVEFKDNSWNKSKLLNNYICGRIKWCFLEIKTVIEHPEVSCKDDRGGSGQFVQKMDVALDMLSSCSGELVDSQLKSTINEVLYHAMSIAHVALRPDFENITDTCQKVLKAFEEVRKCCCSEESRLMKKMNIGCLTSALELLEQQVNTALLKLVLEVFSDLFTPLGNLLVVCQEKSTMETRSGVDLEEMVSVFDLQMDRIMQIGLFALSCANDTHRVVGIRSCLASLESLEPELIPALMAHYQEPNSYAKLTYLKELVGHWKTEVSELKEMIHNIVDPSAFCEVTVGDVQVIVAYLKSNIEDNKTFFLKHQIGAILKKVVLLAQQLKISFRDSTACQLPAEVKQLVEDFYFSCNELDAAYRLYLPDNTQDITLENKLRLLKRCELVVSLMKKIQPFISECLNLSNKESQNSDSKTTLVHKFGSTLHFPDSVRGLPVDIDESRQDSPSRDHVKSIFENIMKQGKIMAKERSILYHTPKKKEFHSTIQCLQISDLTICNANFPTNHHELTTEKTLGLDITAILDKLTFLSDTLTSNQNETVVNGQLDPVRLVCNSVRENMTTGLPRNAPGESSNLCLTKSQVSSTETLTLQCSSSDIDTPQRLEDLLNVKGKIAALQIHLDESGS